ncbi:MAG TPA: DUF4160 domain-containing protein [Candidatus Kapabacteria bacterium]|nr:DUF4160 domain-containing protein [Candidatus Kapabacteria bacterium]HPO63459.1 DUF4160 domain-containing protein [Candidatus Kapabacteria bacterium]
MAILSMFYGIIVSMYYLDNKQHKFPHIHVKYQENEIVISIPDANILEGSIPANKLKLVIAWIEIHKDELMANWELASKGNSVFQIEPLK